MSRELVVEAVATRHTVPSVGYIVWERRKKLKTEYQGLTGDQIRDVRLSGVEVSEERRFPLVAYTGDTAPEGLDANPAMYEAKILITEMSFVAPSHRKDKIHKHGHMHLDDFVLRQTRFQNELVIAAHFSTRYHDKQVLHYVRKSLPGMLDGRLHLWL
jgi:ribonuclease Z